MGDSLVLHCVSCAVEGSEEDGVLQEHAIVLNLPAKFLRKSARKAIAAPFTKSYNAKHEASGAPPLDPDAVDLLNGADLIDSSTLVGDVEWGDVVRIRPRTELELEPDLDGEDHDVIDELYIGTDATEEETAEERRARALEAREQKRADAAASKKFAANMRKNFGGAIKSGPVPTNAAQRLMNDLTEKSPSLIMQPWAAASLHNTHAHGDAGSARKQSTPIGQEGVDELKKRAVNIDVAISSWIGSMPPRTTPYNQAVAGGFDPRDPRARPSAR